MAQDEGLKDSLDRLCKAALEQVKQGVVLLILSNRVLSEHQLPIPTILAVSAINQALVHHQYRDVNILVETGCVRTASMCGLTGFGATAIYPYLFVKLTRFSLKGSYPARKDRFTSISHRSE